MFQNQHLASCSGWWLQPIWKICSSNSIISPIRVENKKYSKLPPPCFKPVSNLSPKIHSKQRRHAQLRQCLSTTAFFKATRRQQIGLDGDWKRNQPGGRCSLRPPVGEFCWFEIWRTIQLLPQCRQSEGLVGEGLGSIVFERWKATLVTWWGHCCWGGTLHKVW